MQTSPERVVEVVRAVLEPLLVLALAFLLTGLATLPFIPMTTRVEVPLLPLAGEIPVDEEELARRIENHGLAGRSVEFERTEGSSRLVLADFPDKDALDELRELLRAAGYDDRGLDADTRADLEALLSGGVGELPVLLSIQAVIFVVAGLLLIRLRVRRGPAPAGPLRATLIGVAGGLAAVLMSVVVSQLLGLIGLPVEEQAWLAELFSDPQAIARLALWVVLVGPISEEIFFRGYIFRSISQRVSFPAGLLVSSALFAAIHFNLSGFLIYLGIGCVLAYAYQMTQSIITPIVGHVVTNLIVLIVSGLAARLDV